MLGQSLSLQSVKKGEAEAGLEPTARLGFVHSPLANVLDCKVSGEDLNSGQGRVKVFQLLFL